MLALDMNNIGEILNSFIQQSKTDNLKWSTYPKEYLDLNMKVSFGQGVPARVSWISFLAPEMQTSNGFYPVYLFYKKENKLIVRAREINSNLKFFKNKFIAPLDDAIITGIYGSQRILNGKPRSPHYGIDFAGKLGTPIKAMANGVVTLAENDLYLSLIHI